ncbi:unnamed protein product, partial [Closterium sp. NIES-53]
RPAPVAVSLQPPPSRRLCPPITLRLRIQPHLLPFRLRPRLPRIPLQRPPCRLRIPFLPAFRRLPLPFLPLPSPSAAFRPSLPYASA